MDFSQLLEQSRAQNQIGKLRKLAAGSTIVFVMTLGSAMCFSRAAQCEPSATETKTSTEPETVVENGRPPGQTGLNGTFAAGIQSYKKSDFKSAAASFQKALSESPRSPSILHNLALTEWKLGHQGLALALWRKALAIDASYEPAIRSIKWFRGRLDHPEIAHEVEYWETFREDFLSVIPLTWLVLLSAGTLLFSGSVLLGFLGAKRRSAIDETPAPELPSLGIGGGIVCVVLVGLALAKVYDLNSDRGTILPTKVQAKSAPDESSTVLFDLFAGLEVQIDQAPDGWLQVTYPGGPTGWVPASAVMRSTGDLPKSPSNSSETNTESPKAGA